MSDQTINNRIGKCGRKRSLLIEIDDGDQRRKEYAKMKVKQMVKCNICGCDVSYYSMSAHKKCAKHLNNLKHIEELNNLKH